MRSRKLCKLLICSVILGRPKIFDALNFNFLLETNHFAIPLSVIVSKGENFRSPAFFTKWWLNLQKIVEQLIDWNFE